MALADCDSFYASCERIARPDLTGRPIVVLSNNDGCIVARSREAKALGIPMGEPEFKVRHLLARHHVAVFSSNYTLYGDLSGRVMATLNTVAPRVEVYSIDEAFIPLPGALARNADELAAEARLRAGRWIGVPVSIGIAPTRVLAKIATRVAKNNPACGGIYNLCHCPDIDGLLASVDAGDIWGIGRKSALKLKMAGIGNALALRDACPAMIRRMLTVSGLNVLMELRGVPSIGEDIPQSHSSVVSSRSLGRRVRDLDTMLEAACCHAARAAEKLRSRGLAASLVCPRVQTAWAEKDKPQHDEWASIALPEPTSDTSVIMAAANRGIRKIFRAGYAYAKVMVMLAGLSEPGRGQLTFAQFTGENSEHIKKRKNLMTLMDKVNRVEGRGTLRFASQGHPDAPWHMRRDRLSPAWTTDIKNLLQVGGGSYLNQFPENLRRW